MELNTLHNQTADNRRRKRVGCGVGSRRGKTSTRGGKGQTARGGGSIRHGFESGHIPLYRKLPRRGFNNANFRTDYSIVNLAELVRIDSDVIDTDQLVEAGLIRPGSELVKILGIGSVARPLTVTADKFSESAKQKIEAAGGKIIVREHPVKQTHKKKDQA